jgi:tetratricopeptide (TPR) repeat protein
MRRVSIKVQDDGTDGPPRALFWGVILLFVLVIVGVVGGIYAFRDVLRPSQQQRVLEQLPFMRAFLPPTPMGGTVPTVDPNLTDEDAANSLLTMPLLLPNTPEATATQAPSATPTELPTEAPTATPTTSSAEAPAAVPPTEAVLAPATMPTVDVRTVGPVIPVAERIVGFTHIQQDWNNCGPATLTMAMSYFGWTRDQQYARTYLRPNREDKNVSPDELVNFVNTRSQLRAIARVGGDLTTLKLLIANRFPVIVERGIMFEAYDWVGHYQLLVAYDDAQRVFYAFDSFLGTGAAGMGVQESYAALDADWRAFNRTYIVLYNPADEDILRDILGARFDERQSAQMALEQAQAEARQNRQDAFAWFNLGSSLTMLERYAEAASAFDRARQLELPWRMLWYQFGIFEAYYNVGRYDDVLSLVQSNLTTSPELEESYYWRGRVFAAQGDRARAEAEFRRALSYNSTFEAARQALARLG